MLNMQIILRAFIFIATFLVKMKNVNPQGSFFMLGCECIVEVLHLFKINIQLSLMSKNRAVGLQDHWLSAWNRLQHIQSLLIG